MDGLVVMREESQTRRTIVIVRGRSRKRIDFMKDDMIKNGVMIEMT